MCILLNSTCTTLNGFVNFSIRHTPSGDSNRNLCSFGAYDAVMSSLFLTLVRLRPPGDAGSPAGSSRSSPLGRYRINQPRLACNLKRKERTEHTTTTDDTANNNASRQVAPCISRAQRPRLRPTARRLGDCPPGDQAMCMAACTREVRRECLMRRSS